MNIIFGVVAVEEMGMGNVMLIMGGGGILGPWY